MEAFDFGSVGTARAVIIPEVVQEQVDQNKAVIAADPFDLGPVRAKLSPFEAELANLATLAGQIEVKDDEAEAMATEIGVKVAKLLKRIEDARTEITRPSFDFKKSVDTLAKSFTAKLEGIKGGLGQKIGAYKHMKELERRKAEKAAQEEAAKLQAKVDAEAKAAGVETVKIEAPVVPVTGNVTRTAAGSSSIRMEWTFEVTDAQQVPREYLAVNEQAIRQAVKSGIREIAGVRIFEKPTTVFRG